MNDANDRDIDDNMDRFEAASSARAITLPTIDLTRILLALDGSNQDTPARDLAERFEATISTASLDSDDSPHRQILDQCRESGSDLIVVPAPFREDFAELGAASIGSNLDRLLSQRDTPLLVVRDPDRASENLTREIVLPLSFVAAEDIRAAAWAFRTLAPGGRIRILAVVDTEHLVRDHRLEGGALDVEDLEEFDLAGLDQPGMAGLIAAVQRHAAENDVGCRVSIRVGATVKATAEFANAQPCILAVTCPLDDTDPAYADVHSLTRQSRNPVLIV